MKLEHLFYYCAPNRRSDRTVIEIILGWTQDEERLIGRDWQAALEHIRGLENTGWTGLCPKDLPDPGDTGQFIAGFSGLLAQLALALQQSCGHTVSWQERRVDRQRSTTMVLFEHEETSVGEQAGMAALLLLEEAFPALSIDFGDRRPGQPASGYLEQFREHALSLVQPTDTAAIIEAARTMGVPVIKLERDPYDPVKGEFRIRMNSMLMLGHCAHRQVIDGTFAIERSGKAAALLGQDHQTIQIGHRLGMPVILPGNPAQPSHSLLLCGFEYCLLKDLRTGDVCTGGVHPELIALCASAAQALDVGMLEVQLECTGELNDPITQSGAVVTRLDPAPRLDEYCGQFPELMKTAAEHFVRWLIPAGRDARIPIAAVTGTNGKTTTSRMIAQIFQASGLHTGLQCTDGRYFNGELLEAGDSSTLMGHYRLFEDRRTEAAVLETHHRGMAEYGFAFDWCDVAVCTNVTYDHIGYSNIHSIAEMAELKKSLPERAKRCAVLNADNPECLAMTSHLYTAVCLVSARETAEKLLSLDPAPSSVCVLERINGREQVVFYHGSVPGQDREVIMPIKDIPATFSGKARFNVLNAMQAIAAGLAMGIGTDHIREAMSGFTMGLSNTPGRMNFYASLPFQVLVDFAHNPDGALQLAEFAQSLDIAGKRIVAFSSFRSDATIYGATDNISDRYDHYFVKEYGIPPGYKSLVFPRPKGKIIEMIHARLIENGIDENDITIIPDEMEAVRAALDSASEGDLVVLMLGYTAMEVIESFMDDYIRTYHAKEA